MIIATCGHQLTEAEDFGTMIAVKQYARDGGKAVGFPVVCDKCLKWYKRKKLILNNQQQAEWLGVDISQITWATF